MNKIGKIVIVAALAIVVGMVVVAKQNKSSTTNTAVKNDPCMFASAESSKEINEIKKDGQTVEKLPRLVDLGASSCIPCKMMTPILEDIKKEYAGRLEVVFIDVRENPGASKEYKIRIIPTQIFYDASDKEKFRHEGFMSKEDILAKWKDLGVNLKMEKQ
jgi:thioredoxin